MKFNNQSLIDKYIPISLESVNLEPDLLDFEKNIILEENSQIPNLVLNSHCPFDKNYCFYDIALNVSTKENIFPKEIYVLKSQQIIEEKPIDINSIFESSDILPSSPNTLELTNTINNEKNNDNNNQIIDDENSVQNKIISTIKNKHYKSYTPKYLNINNNNINNGDIPNSKLSENDTKSDEPDNEWYIIGNNIKEGPYNDTNMYNKIYKIYYDSLSKKEKVPHYIVNEKKSNIFMTMDDCFDKLKKKQDAKKQTDVTSQSNQQISQTPNAISSYINNALFYQNQMMRYYQMKNMILLNNANFLLNNQRNFNNNNNRKGNPNKFDNLTQGNSLNSNIENVNTIKGSHNTFKSNYKGQNYHHNYNNNNNQRKNKFNNRTFNNKNNDYKNSHKNKFNTKGNTNRMNQDKDIKDNNDNDNNNKDDHPIKNENEIKMTSLDVDKLFNEN